MSADLPDRLRAIAESWGRSELTEAADEIDRLRDAVWSAGQAPVDQWTGKCHSCGTQIVDEVHYRPHAAVCPWLKEHERRNP